MYSLETIPPEKHFRIFLSSTYKDLVEMRDEILEHIRSQRDIIIGMEEFPPDDRAATDYIDEQIKKSDAFVLIVGLNVGSYTQKNKRYVEHEILTAQKLKKPIFVFSPDSETEGTKYFLPIMEKNKVRTTVKYYSAKIGSSDLTTQFVRGYPNIKRRLETTPYCGLVPSEKMRHAFHFPGFNQNLRKSPELSDALVKLSHAMKLISRSHENHGEKKAAAFCVLRNFANKIFPKSSNRELFFDGGSSVIVASGEFLKYYERYGVSETNITLSTNSPHTLLNIIYTKRHKDPNLVGPALFPTDGYYDMYGTFLGDAMKDFPETTQSYWSSGKYKDYKCAESILEHTLKQRFDNTNPVIFSSVSGYATSKNKRLSGPWVKSIPNYYFKRQLMGLKVPIIMLLDEKKWRRPMLTKGSVCIYSKEQKFHESKASICYSAGFTNQIKYEDFKSYFENKKGFKVQIIEDYPDTDGKFFAACAYTKAFATALTISNDSCE